MTEIVKGTPEAAKEVERWAEAYLRAWTSNDPDDIKALFTEGAEYFTEPDSEPWVGHEGIVRGWLDRKDEPDEWTFHYEVMLALEGGPSFVRGWTDYTNEGKSYSNLWVIHLSEDGLAREFTEWVMEIDAS